MKTIKQRIEEKIGNNYDKLFAEYIEKHPKSKRAFYVLDETYKKARNGAVYYTGIKIEKINGKTITRQHRMCVTGATYEVVA